MYDVSITNYELRIINYDLKDIPCLKRLNQRQAVFAKRIMLLNIAGTWNVY